MFLQPCGMTTKVDRKDITREALYELVWEEPLGAVAERLSLSPNGVGKLCDRLNIPRPTRTYWSRPADRLPRPPLGPAPDGVDDRVIIGRADFVARRPRTRLPLKQRREQLLDEAARIALAHGLQEVTLKRLAREVGITEAQAHNCFTTRHDLLLALARREVEAVEARRQSHIVRGGDATAGLVLSTLSYLHDASQRGPLLQVLLRSAEIRHALRAERSEAAAMAREPILERLTARQGLERPTAYAATAALTAVCLRAGGLLASRRIDLETAERLCLAIIMAGSRSNAAVRAASPG